MLRKILGFAVLAIVAVFALNLALSLFGVAIGVAWWLLKLALVGLVVYWVLKLISPSTARKVDEMIKGPPATGDLKRGIPHPRQRDQQLVVAGDGDAAAAGLRRPVHDVHTRAIVTDHVEVGGEEVRRPAGADVPRHSSAP
jgi:hypothetical protein